MTLREPESLGTILKRVMADAEEARANLPDGWIPAPDQALEELCATCHDRGFVTSSALPTDPRFGQPKACPDCTPQREAARLASTLPEAYRDSTFAALDKRLTLSKAQQEAWHDAWKAAWSFTEPGGLPWLVLAGAPGSGKTELAACIFNKLAARGQPARFVVVPDMLQSIKDGFEENTASGRMEMYRIAPVLILDDLGSEQLTPWAQGQVFNLLNDRYNRGACTVVTLNDWRFVGERTEDRMRDVRLSAVCELNVPSYRRVAR
jgi:DNA replication protein DnaC